MGSIIVKDAEHLIPDDALSTVLKKFSKGYALCFPMEGQLETESQKVAFTSMESALEEINKIQCPLKAETLVYYFTNYEDKLLEEDTQPFICIAGKKDDGSPDPLVVCFLDGEIDDAFEPDASGHTREYMAVNSYLAVKLQRLYAQVGDDLEDFLKQLEDPLLKREMLGTLFDGTGDLVLIAATGEIPIFGIKSQEKTFDWGWMSNPCGYGEAPDKTKPDPISQGMASAAKSVLANIRTKGVMESIRAGAASISKPEPEPTAGPTMVWVRPPAHIRSASNNKKKSWYESRISVVPESWKNCPAIPMDIVRATKEALEIQTREPGPAEKKEEPKLPDAPLPIIPPAQQTYIVDTFLKTPAIAKFLDANSQAIPNPAQDEETKYPTFCDKAGLPGLEAVLKWDYAARLPLFKNAPEAANTLFGDLLRAYVSQLNEKPKTVQEPVKPSTPATAAPAASILPKPGRKRM